MLVFVEGEKQRVPVEKLNPRSKDENQQQTQPNGTQATLLGGRNVFTTAPSLLPSDDSSRLKDDKFITCFIGTRR